MAVKHTGMNENLLKQWGQIVGTMFKSGRPNGMLLGWEISRFFQSLKQLCEGCTVVNQTDFNYAYCNTYEIRPGVQDVASICELTLNISFIVEAYTLHWTRYSLDLRRGEVVAARDVQGGSILTSRVSEFMRWNGYADVPSEWLDVPIPDAQLELAEEATLGKCLFHDFE